tara:strand:- start:3542 stop:3688 length:147 start_codon:yes stop_codon:yes gene_type:complete
MEITIDCEYCFIRSYVRFEDAAAAEAPIYCPGCGSKVVEENTELDFDV